MKVWVPILFLFIVLLIAVLWTRRERFSPGAVDPECPGGTILDNMKCMSVVGPPDDTNGQCAPDTVLRDGLCRRESEPRCPAMHTLKTEDGVVRCEPNPATSNASQQGQCPSGFLKDKEFGDGSIRCKKEVGQPKCPTGYTMSPLVKMGEGAYNGGMCDKGGESTAPQCDGESMLNVINDRRVCVEYAFVNPAGSSNTTGGSSTTESGVTPASVRKNTVLGPVFTSYGSPVDGSGPDSYKSNQYPELLGGGDPVARKREQDAGVDLKGSLPSMGSLGATEASKFFPFSRQPGDMDLIPDPYRVSQQFSSASYSFKTEPTPFLTDFSAFLK